MSTRGLEDGAQVEIVDMDRLHPHELDHNRGGGGKGLSPIPSPPLHFRWYIPVVIRVSLYIERHGCPAIEDIRFGNLLI